MKYMWWGLDQDKAYFAWVIGADCNAKLWSYEGVVDEAGYILKWLAVVLTGRKIVSVKLNANKM